MEKGNLISEYTANSLSITLKYFIFIIYQTPYSLYYSIMAQNGIELYEDCQEDSFSDNFLIVY